jgi:hypothetical protein
MAAKAKWIRLAGDIGIISARTNEPTIAKASEMLTRPAVDSSEFLFIGSPLNNQRFANGEVPASQMPIDLASPYESGRTCEGDDGPVHSHRSQRQQGQSAAPPPHPALSGPLCGHAQDKEHAMSQTLKAAIALVGIDIGKNSFHIVGHDRRGAIVLRQKWSRGQVETRLANMPPCLIGVEACVGAHHLSRKLNGFRHDARLMPAKYVRPYSKGQKNDFRDAEAIAEAVQRPTMKFVATKMMDQLDLQALHRVRERLVSQRTGIINQIRAFLLGRGIAVRQGQRYCGLGQKPTSDARSYPESRLRRVRGHVC